MPELDTLRGIAILAVLFYHGFEWSYGLNAVSGFAKLFMYATLPGWLGVNLFFVLSGFLITGVLLDSRSRPRFYRNFYTRRCFRILPAYYAVLILLALCRYASWPFFLMSFFYLNNFGPLLAIPNAYGVLWSLSVEEHFYFLWPVAIKKLSNKGLLLLAFTIVAGVPVIRLLSFYTGHETGLSGYTWCVADGLAAGAMLRLLLMLPGVSRRVVFRTATGVICVCILAVVLGSNAGILTRTTALGAAFQVSPFNLGFSALLALALLAGTNARLRPLVQVGLLRFFGDISYGLYLIHLLLFSLYDKSIARFLPSLIATRGQFALMMCRFLLVGATAVGVS
jgi:peptidoglycan/LPS O-acetylase OafA/YrhL